MLEKIQLIKVNNNFEIISYFYNMVWKKKLRNKNLIFNSL